MTQEQRDRLRELQQLEADDVWLDADEYAELDALMVAENEAFVAEHS